MIEDVGSAGLVVSVLGCVFVGLLFGLVTASLIPPERLERSTAFAWGFAFGPIGLAVALSMRARFARRVRRQEPWGGV